MRLAEAVRRGDVVDQRASGVLPVDPGDLVVLRVGVVVALLRATHLVALLKQRHAARHEERGEQRTHVAFAREVDPLVFSHTLDAAVPRLIVVVAVAIAFAVRLVVLVAIRDEIEQREPVMHGEEVHPGARFAAGKIVDLGRTRDLAGERANLTRLAAPEAADLVAISVVPLAEFLAVLADAVPPRTWIPRLGDE